jgi:hypothetical protein
VAAAQDQFEARAQTARVRDWLGHHLGHDAHRNEACRFRIALLERSPPGIEPGLGQIPLPTKVAHGQAALTPLLHYTPPKSFFVWIALFCRGHGHLLCGGLHHARQARDWPDVYDRKTTIASGERIFSYADLMARKAGTRFSEVALRDGKNARTLQDRLNQPFSLDDFYPQPDGLRQNGHGDNELVTAAGKVTGSIHDENMKEIEKRLDDLPGYRGLN